jgi:acyl-homoserine lactone acylase PvdQ
VPHIYGNSEEAAIFGQGYAQAEDRLPTIYRAYRKTIGTMAEAFGPEWVEHDYQQHLFGHLGTSRGKYPSLSRENRKMGESFLSGIKAFIQEHPEEVPDWYCDIEPHGLITLGWFVISKWQLGEAVSKLRRGRVDIGASNEWSIGRSRSREGYPMACIDPHVSWKDEWLFFESHLHGGNLHAYGFSPVGTPYISLGHNERLCWAMTTGGPDTSDVYEEELDDDGSKYLYDGEWRDIERRTVEIGVRTPNGMEFVERNIMETHHGPIVKVVGNRGYSFKLSLHREVGLIDQLRLMNKARDLGDFLKAMSMLQLMPQNTMYTDVYGNSYYQRTGRVPIRPSGYDWSKPVPGNTSKTEWLGIHPMEDLVQLLNPPTGFMQNCNISPGNMTFNSPLTSGRYRDYLYNVSWDGQNTRGSRFLEIMRQTNKVGLEDALKIMVDSKLYGTEAMISRIERTPLPTGNAHFEEAVAILTDWDGQADIESVGMSLYTQWLKQLRKEVGREGFSRIAKSKRLGKEDGDALVDALSRACEFLEEKFGTIRVSWGDINRGRRGDRSWPLAGCGETLRSIGVKGPNEEGISYGEKGQSCPTLVLLKDPIESFSAVPYGQSEKPGSPHFTDQGEKLFAKRLLKPTWFSKVDLLKNIESMKSFELPG